MIKKHIPNTITLLNATSGSIAVFILFSGYSDMSLAVLFIIAAAIFDFLDGFAARLLKVTSKIGKELDSLSDLISFGLAPTAIMFRLILQSLNIETTEYISQKPFVFLPLISLMIVAFSALRLAIFNMDTEQHHEFKGLATPANTLLIASLVFIQDIPSLSFIFNPYVLSFLSIGLSLLLVSCFPMFSFKLQSMKFNDNIFQYLFVVISILLLVVWQLQSIFFIMCLYLILNGIRYFVKK